MLTVFDATLAAVCWFSGLGRVAGLVVADDIHHGQDRAVDNREYASGSGRDCSSITSPYFPLSSVLMASSRLRFGPTTTVRHGRMLPSSITSREVTKMSQSIQREPAFL
jgi:hypothetical protein